MNSRVGSVSEVEYRATYRWGDGERVFEDGLQQSNQDFIPGLGNSNTVLFISALERKRVWVTDCWRM
jgi:hypothetical protein